MLVVCPVDLRPELDGRVRHLEVLEGSSEVARGELEEDARLRVRERERPAPVDDELGDRRRLEPDLVHQRDPAPASAASAPRRAEGFAGSAALDLSEHAPLELDGHGRGRSARASSRTSRGRGRHPGGARSGSSPGSAPARSFVKYISVFRDTRRSMREIGGSWTTSCRPKTTVRRSSGLTVYRWSPSSNQRSRSSTGTFSSRRRGTTRGAPRRERPRRRRSRRS